MKRSTISAALAGVLSLASVSMFAGETPERAGAPSAGERPLLKSPSPPTAAVVEESEAAVAEAGEQKPADAGEPKPADAKPPVPNPPAATPPAAQPANSAGDPAKQLEDLRAELAAAQKEIATLKKSVDDLSRLVTQTDQNLRDILHQVAEQDGGAWKLKVNALSDKDGKPRPDVVRITQGRLLIDNTGKERVLYVNGTPWTAIAGKSFIWVPVGACSIATEGGAQHTVYETGWKRNVDTGVFEMKFTF